LFHDIYSSKHHHKMSYSDIPSYREVANLAVRANAVQDLKDGSSPLIALSKALNKLPDWSHHQRAQSPTLPSPSIPDPPAELIKNQGKTVESRLKNLFGFIRGLDLKSKPKKEVSEIYDEVHAAVANPVTERPRSAPIPASITLNNNTFITNANAAAFASNDVPATSESKFYSNNFAAASHPMIVAPIPRFGAGCTISTESLASALQRRLGETEEDDPVARRISEIRSNTSIKPVSEILNPLPSTDQEIEDWERNGYDADDDEINPTDKDDVNSLDDLESMGSVDSLVDDARDGRRLCQGLEESGSVVVTEVPVLMVVPPDEEGRGAYVWDEGVDEEERRGRARERLISRSGGYLLYRPRVLGGA
jgi:hypothetical protein